MFFKAASTSFLSCLVDLLGVGVRGSPTEETLALLGLLLLLWRLVEGGGEGWRAGALSPARRLNEGRSREGGALSGW
jgi:hypothetical protein